MSSGCKSGAVCSGRQLPRYKGRAVTHTNKSSILSVIYRALAEGSCGVLRMHSGWKKRGGKYTKKAGEREGRPGKIIIQSRSTTPKSRLIIQIIQIQRVNGKEKREWEGKGGAKHHGLGRSIFDGKKRSREIKGRSMHKKGPETESFRPN